ncbi:hypothetical protein Q1695_004478 [Nippostrongylus brasiliensis]|nr:hypothetical protein Q1695_004478 [Nippostrongylus brasiliensis]
MRLKTYPPLWYLLCFVVSLREASPICSPGQIACVQNRKCIPRTWLCDGAKDCEDGSDEEPTRCNSEPSNIKCPNGQRKCVHFGVQRCIPQTWLCDGQRDCDSGEDEASCLGPSSASLPCGSFEHSCDNRCLQLARLCDGVVDCRDGSDEGPRRCLDKAVIRGKLRQSRQKLPEAEAAKNDPTNSSKRPVNRFRLAKEEDNATTMASQTSAVPSRHLPVTQSRNQGPVENSKNSSASPGVISSPTTVVPSVQEESNTQLNYRLIDPIWTNHSTATTKIKNDSVRTTKVPNFAVQPSTRGPANPSSLLPIKAIVIVHKREVSNNTQADTQGKKPGGYQHENTGVPLFQAERGRQVVSMVPVNSIVGVPIRPMNFGN